MSSYAHIQIHSESYRLVKGPRCGDHSAHTHAGWSLQQHSPCHSLSRTDREDKVKKSSLPTQCLAIDTGSIALGLRLTTPPTTPAIHLHVPEYTESIQTLVYVCMPGQTHNIVPRNQVFSSTLSSSHIELSFE